MLEVCLQAYRHRPFGSLDNELDHHAEDDDHDGCDDHDYIDDSETDSSDSILEPHSSVRAFMLSFRSRLFQQGIQKKRRSPLNKALPICLPGPSAPEPKLPIVRSNGPPTLENPNPAVTSGQFPSFTTSGAFANMFSFRFSFSCPPYSEFSTPVACSSSCRQSTRR